MYDMTTDHDYRDDRYDRYDYRDDRYDRYDYRRGRRMGRNYRNYREEDFITELEECVEKGMHKYREYEDLAELAEDKNDKNTIMKIAEREKEHYKTLKEMLERHM